MLMPRGTNKARKALGSVHSLVITTMARHLPCVKRLMDIQRYLLSPFSFHIEEQKIPELRHQKQKCYSRIMNSDIVISVAQVTNISA